MARSSSVRERLLIRVEKVLANKNILRIQMSLMVLVTALSGLLASFLMLKLGIKLMWARYPLAVLFAYGAFIFMVWLWIQLYRRKLDAIDLVNVSPGDMSGSSVFGGFGGGRSGGGGASSSFASDANVVNSSSKDGGILGSLDLSFDSDELVVVLIILIAVLFAAVVAVLAVVTAPALLGEVLVDSILAAGLYRQLKKIEQRNWLESVIRRTWWSALGLFILFTIAGFVFNWYAPGTDSIGDIWAGVTAKQP